MKTLTVAIAALLLLPGCANWANWSHRTAEKPATAPATFAPTTVADLGPVDAALLQRPTTEFKLGPGDVLEIEVLGDISTRARTTVGPDGKIYFYILPGIDVWGLTVAQAHDRIVQELQKFVRDQQPVTVTLRSVESQRIWVLGRLNKPGVYPMSGPMTLLEAISEAGGPSPATAVSAFSGGMMGSNARGANDE